MREVPIVLKVLKEDQIDGTVRVTHEMTLLSFRSVSQHFIPLCPFTLAHFVCCPTERHVGKADAGGVV